MREFVRDYIDSRITAGEFFVYFAIVVAGLSTIPNATLLNAVMWVWTGMLAMVIVDTVFLTFTLRRSLAANFTTGTRGAVRYGLLRALQVRPLRLPKPRVRLGGKPKVRK